MSYRNDSRIIVIVLCLQKLDDWNIFKSLQFQETVIRDM